MRPMIDIVLPCYNPQKGWADRVVRTYDLLSQHDPSWDFRLIIVNDGSSKGVEQRDITYITERVSAFKWISYETNRGKGYALRQGVEECTGDIILLTDIDFPYTLESMAGLMEALLTEDAVEVLAGERDVQYYKHTPKVRKWISKLLKGVVKTLLRLPVTDTQCGLKGMKSVARPVFLQTTIDRYLFDVEFLWMAAKRYSVRPYPVTLREGIVFSKMNARILLTEGWNFVELFARSFVGR